MDEKIEVPRAFRDAVLEMFVPSLESSKVRIERLWTVAEAEQHINATKMRITTSGVLTARMIAHPAFIEGYHQGYRTYYNRQNPDKHADAAAYINETYPLLGAPSPTTTKLVRPWVELPGGRCVQFDGASWFIYHGNKSWSHYDSAYDVVQNHVRKDRDKWFKAILKLSDDLTLRIVQPIDHWAEEVTE